MNSDAGLSDQELEHSYKVIPHLKAINESSIKVNLL